MRPALFFGNNPISLAGGAITSASGVTMISYWLVELFGRANDNPYLGIIFFLLLPGLFIAGLLLIPVGVFLRRRKLQKADRFRPSFPRSISTTGSSATGWTSSGGHDREPAGGGDGELSGAAYMDSPQFCGQSCHVMHPEYTAYKISAHSHVACVECHIGSGAQAYFSAKVNGTKQLLEVSFDRYPTPIPSPVTSLRPARVICEGCHTPARFVGEKLLVKSNFADDEQNTETPDGAGSAPGRRGFALSSERHSRRSPEPHGVHRHRFDPDHHPLGAAGELRRLADRVCLVRAERRLPRANGGRWTASIATTAPRTPL